MDGHKKDWVVYYKLMLANGTSSLYRAALELNLLDREFGVSFSAHDIAREHSYQITPLLVLLDGLVAIGILEKNNENYSLAQVMVHFKGSYQNLGQEYWSHLSELIKSGIPHKKENSNPIEDYKAQVTSLGWMMESSAIEIVKILNIKSCESLDIIDIGAGSGVWSYQILKCNSIATAHLIDWPFLLESLKNQNHDLDISKRFRYSEGNPLVVPFESQKYDYAIMGNLTHLHSPESNLLLFQKSFEALKPGGSLIILDAFSKDERGREARALYQMGFTLKTGVGRVYPSEVLYSWLEKVGFSSYELHSLDVVPYTMGMYIAKK